MSKVKFNQRDLSLPQVLRYTKWSPKYSGLPNLAGVYILADKNGVVIYVGKAGAGRLNLESRSAMKVRGKGRGASLIRSLITCSNQKAKSLERYLIGKYKPRNNIYLK